MKEKSELCLALRLFGVNRQAAGRVRHCVSYSDCVG